MCDVAVGCRCALLRVVPRARRAPRRDRGVQAVRDHEHPLRPEPVPLPQEGKSCGDAVGVGEAVLPPVARGDLERLQLDPLARLDADESEPSSEVGLDPFAGRLNEALLERQRGGRHEVAIAGSGDFGTLRHGRPLERCRRRRRSHVAQYLETRALYDLDGGRGRAGVSGGERVGAEVNLSLVGTCANLGRDVLASPLAPVLARVVGDHAVGDAVAGRELPVARVPDGSARRGSGLAEDEELVELGVVNLRAFALARPARSSSGSR